MKNNFLCLTFDFATLLFGCAFEDLLPTVGNVGWPVLLSLVHLRTLRRPLPVAVVFAILAGSLEDAISSLPLLTSVSYFLLMVAVTYWTRLTHLCIFISYPIYQIWLLIWLPSLQGSMYMRILISSLVGGVAIFAVGACLMMLERRVALDESE